MKLKRMKINCKKVPIILIVVILSCNSNKNESTKVEINQLNQKNLNVQKGTTKDDEMPNTGINKNTDAEKLISLDVIKENSKKEIEDKLKEEAEETATALKKEEETAAALKKAKEKAKNATNNNNNNNKPKPKPKPKPKSTFITFNTGAKKPKTNNSTKTNNSKTKIKTSKKRKQFSEAKIKYKQNIDFRSNEKIIIETKKDIEYGKFIIPSHTLLTAYYTRKGDRLILKINPIIINDIEIVLDKLKVMDYGDKLIGLKANLVYIKANQTNKKTVNKLLNTGTALVTSGTVAGILNENVEEKTTQNARLETYILEKNRPVLIKNIK